MDDKVLEFLLKRIDDLTEENRDLKNTILILKDKIS
jgi:hypothetical protein|tara:strand:- start:97 stop:204 length:108 start_codon:yes stop_codon:yes gene_type:complete